MKVGDWYAVCQVCPPKSYQAVQNVIVNDKHSFELYGARVVLVDRGNQKLFKR